MGAYPFLTSTDFAKGWYIRMVEGFDAEVRDKVGQLESEIAYQERQLDKAKTAESRRRARERLREAQRRLQDYIDFYGEV